MPDDQSINNLLVDALLKDRKSERRWKVIRSFLWAFIFLLYAYFLFSVAFTTKDDPHAKKPYVSLIRLEGVIMPNTNFSARKVVPELNHAFRDQKSRGVVLVINSPGGSPVQAYIIHDKILQLKHRYKKKVVVVGLDALASGAYLVSTAADKIYVSPDTLTGSIGVIMSSFGFSDAIEKLGVSRRVFTAGKNKDRLDPFKPLNPADAAKIHKLLNEVHQHFINDVTQGRGQHLSSNHEELFSGDFWTGSTAVSLGLADATGTTWEAMKKEFNVTHYRNYTTKPSLFQVFLEGAEATLHLALNQKSSQRLIEALP